MSPRHDEQLDTRARLDPLPPKILSRRTEIANISISASSTKEMYKIFLKTDKTFTLIIVQPSRSIDSKQKLKNWD